MIDVRYLLNILSKGNLAVRLFVLLFISLLPLANLWIFFTLLNWVPIYLLLSLVTTLSLCGFFLSYHLVDKKLQEIRTQVRNGIYPDRDFSLLTGRLVISFFLILPGFLTNLIALFLLIPFFNFKLGELFSKGFKKNLKEVYEYIKLYEVDF